MTKLGDLQTKKTIHELSKEFPEKTYAELEKYRNADRNEEAQQIFIPEDEVAKEADALMMNKIIKYEERIEKMQKEIDRVKRENNDLHNKVAALLEAVDPVQKARESGL
jgi:uncharacterized coiled-coil DUF342 family protein